MSFSLSAHDVVSEETIDEICKIVEQSTFPGDRIDFEITEIAIITDFESVRSSPMRLRARGTFRAR